MDADESTSKPSARKALTALLLPRTLQGRLAFLGVVLFLVSEMVILSALGPGTLITVLADAVWIWAWVVAIRDRRRRQKHLTIRRAFAVGAGLSAGLIVLTLAADLGTRVLTFIAAGGNASGDVGSSDLQSAQIDQWAGIALVLVAFWLLVRIPQQLFKIKLDTHSTEEMQRVLLGLLTAAASVLTGIYILLLHFGGGPLGQVRPGPLVAGVIGTVVLVAPSYRSLARACWQRGISGVFSPRGLKHYWGETLAELVNALNRSAERCIASSNSLSSEAGKTTLAVDNASTSAFHGASELLNSLSHLCTWIEFPLFRRIFGSTEVHHRSPVQAERLISHFGYPRSTPAIHSRC